LIIVPGQLILMSLESTLLLFNAYNESRHIVYISALPATIELIFNTGSRPQLGRGVTSE